MKTCTGIPRTIYDSYLSKESYDGCSNTFNDQEISFFFTADKKQNDTIFRYSEFEHNPSSSEDESD